jgi:hypothetical protein
VAHSDAENLAHVVPLSELRIALLPALLET